MYYLRSLVNFRGYGVRNVGYTRNFEKGSQRIREMGNEVGVTSPKSLRSRVKGNFQARFCRRGREATP